MEENGTLLGIGVIVLMVILEANVRKVRNIQISINGEIKFFDLF